MLPKSSEVRFAAILEGSGELSLYSAVFQEDQAFPLFKISEIQATTHQYVFLFILPYIIQDFRSSATCNFLCFPQNSETVLCIVIKRK